MFKIALAQTRVYPGNPRQNAAVMKDFIAKVRTEAVGEGLARLFAMEERWPTEMRGAEQIVAAIDQLTPA